MRAERSQRARGVFAACGAVVAAAFGVVLAGRCAEPVTPPAGLGVGGAPPDRRGAGGGGRAALGEAGDGDQRDAGGEKGGAEIWRIWSSCVGPNARRS